MVSIIASDRKTFFRKNAIFNGKAKNVWKIVAMLWVSVG